MRVLAVEENTVADNLCEHCRKHADSRWTTGRAAAGEANICLAMMVACRSMDGL